MCRLRCSFGILETNIGSSNDKDLAIFPCVDVVLGPGESITESSVCSLLLVAFTLTEEQAALKWLSLSPVLLSGFSDAQPAEKGLFPVHHCVRPASHTGKYWYVFLSPSLKHGPKLCLYLYEMLHDHKDSLTKDEQNAVGVFMTSLKLCGHRCIPPNSPHKQDLLKAMKEVKS